MHDCRRARALQGVVEKGYRRSAIPAASRHPRPRHLDRARPHQETFPPGAALSTACATRGQAGIRLFDLGQPGQGIVHVIGPELGLTLPGTPLVCGDSHTCTHGGMGALAFGIGSREVVHVLATQTMVQRKPKRMRVTFEGTRPPA